MPINGPGTPGMILDVVAVRHQDGSHTVRVRVPVHLSDVPHTMELWRWGPQAPNQRTLGDIGAIVGDLVQEQLLLAWGCQEQLELGEITRSSPRLSGATGT